MPFAAAFSPEGHLLVVEVFGRQVGDDETGAVSSYAIQPDGTLRLISASVDTMQHESCWIASAGPYAYVTNFGSGSITGYRVGADGSLRLLDDSGVIAATGDGSHPVDLAVTSNGRFLYALLPGTSQIAAYQVNMDGSLTALGMASGDWPIGIQGMVVY